MIAVHELSERRACKLANLDRSTFQYEKQTGDDAALREALKALAGKRRRFGYRRLGILLEREGHSANHKKVFRIYSEEGLSVRRRRGRKRAVGTRTPMLVPTGPNQRWSLDFVSDALSDGRRFSELDTSGNSLWIGMADHDSVLMSGGGGKRWRISRGSGTLRSG